MRRAAALLMLVAACAQAGGQAPALVQPAADAAAKLNYRGLVVQIDGGFTQTLRVLHRAGPHGGEDRIHSLQGDYWELQRTGEDCRVGLSGPRTVRDDALVAAMFPGVFPDRLARLVPYFDFERIGSGRVAGRAADFVLARPRDQYRFPRVFATDVETGLLLKTSLLDARGHEIRQAFFVDLQLLPAVPKDEWEHRDVAATALTWADYTLDPRPDKTLPWRINLPPGFSIVGYSQAPMRAGGPPVEQISISNGLTSMSVYVDKAAGGESPKDGLIQSDAINALVTKVGGDRVTLIGPVPTATLQEVAKGFAPAESAVQSVPAADVAGAAQ